MRLLGLIERRGFLPLAVQTRPGQAEGTLDVEVGVTPKGALRSVAVLARHLRKLHEVREVSCFTTPDRRARVPEPVAC